MSNRNGGESYIEAKYGEGEGDVILDDVVCTGNETSLSDCEHREPFTSNCEHDEDVSVKCFLSDTTLGKRIIIKHSNARKPLITRGTHHAKTDCRTYADSEGPDQPEHPRSLIRAFAVCKQNYLILKNA